MTWTELEGLLIGEYADKRTAMEAMKILMKLAQMKDEFPGETGLRADKLTEECLHTAPERAHKARCH